jgi:hypothetical protein
MTSNEILPEFAIEYAVELSIVATTALAGGVYKLAKSIQNNPSNADPTTQHVLRTLKKEYPEKKFTLDSGTIKEKQIPKKNLATLLGSFSDFFYYYHSEQGYEDRIAKNFGRNYDPDNPETTDPKEKGYHNYSGNYMTDFSNCIGGVRDLFSTSTDIAKINPTTKESNVSKDSSIPKKKIEEIVGESKEITSKSEEKLENEYVSVNITKIDKYKERPSTTGLYLDIITRNNMKLKLKVTQFYLSWEDNVEEFSNLVEIGDTISFPEKYIKGPIFKVPYNQIKVNSRQTHTKTTSSASPYPSTSPTSPTESQSSSH